MEPVLSTKRSILLETNYELCIICQETSNDQLYKLTSRGIETFINAMEQRRGGVFDRLHSLVGDRENFLSNSPLCHRSCRSAYTHKKGLETFCTKKARLDNNTPSTSRSRRESQQLDFKKNCFICEKARDSRGSWNLVVLATTQRQQTMHLKAKSLNDEKMLMKIEGYGDEPVDMIAADFRYHKSCMDRYMNTRLTDMTDVSQPSTAYDSAFNHLSIYL